MSFNLSDYHYKLPQNRIATKPASPRESAKVLVVNRQKESFIEKRVGDFADLLPKNSILVVNNTKVIPARLEAKRKSGGKLEILFVEALGEHQWKCKIKNLKKIQIEENITSEDGLSQFTLVKKNEDGTAVLETDKTKEELLLFLEQKGNAPIPPYILKSREEEVKKTFDLENYQTVFAKQYGAVAAPTAGLHFTTNLLQKIQAKGIEILEVTLHVGLGTFTNVEVDDIRDHKIHHEWATISDEVAQKINDAKKSGKKIIATGTTSVRTLEGFWENGVLQSGSKSIQIFIYPSYKFKLVDQIITNFHLSESTLLMLVSAFYTREKIMETYEYAINNNFRFYSYGDCMLIQ